MSIKIIMKLTAIQRNMNLPLIMKKNLRKIIMKKNIMKLRKSHLPLHIKRNIMITKSNIKKTQRKANLSSSSWKRTSREFC
jgi:hypothetical protein